MVDLAPGWEFVRGRVSRGWLAGRGPADEVVDLPHCWNAHDTFQIGRRSYAGWGAYRRRIELPAVPAATGGGWRLSSDGFYGVGEVRLDGRLVSTIDGQFLGLDLGLPEVVAQGPHLLAIRLDNRYHRNVLPGYRNPDFILHGGLAGGLRLEWVPTPAFDLGRLSVVAREAAAGSEVVTISWAAPAGSKRRTDASVTWEIRRADGTSVAATTPRAVRRKDRKDGGPPPIELTIPDPRCWSPESPELYWAEGRITAGGVEADTVRLRFGITRAEFRPRQGFFLDGERVELHGCNRHAAIPGFGNALPPELHRRDAQLIKDYGCNFVRLSHYPQSPVFLDACDELGLMVYAEIATWKSVRSARSWRRAARRQMRDMILRDRHHPSVILWGMGNESRSRKAYLELRDIARELDPGRPVSYAENHLYRARRERTIGIPDVWGVNYELDLLETACAASRLENVVVSECCNHPRSLKGDDFEELTQVATLEQEWERMADLEYVAGHAVWSLTDYATEYRRRFRRHTGLFDAWRRPKMAAELLRARYAERPFVSLYLTGPGPKVPPSRYRREHRSDGEGRPGLELHAFTNCETLRLARDGSMLAVLEGAIHHVLPLYGSFEEIIATGSRNGSVVQDALRRHGQAERVQLKTASDSPGPTIALDVEIHDAAGTLVTDWNGVVRLTAEGPGRVHPLNGSGEVVMARGVGRAYVTLTDAVEDLVVTAAAPGLLPGILSLHA